MTETNGSMFAEELINKAKAKLEKLIVKVDKAKKTVVMRDRKVEEAQKEAVEAAYRRDLSFSKLQDFEAELTPQIAYVEFLVKK